MEIILILIVITVMSGVGAYYYTDFKRKEYIQDYQVSVLEEELAKKKSRDELDAHIRLEQENKKFYMDVILTHGSAIGVKAASDSEGRWRRGILPIGDIMLVDKNARGEDYYYRIDEAGMEIWATFEKDELILKSKENAFEIRTEGTPRDKGTRTFKATLREGQQYYVILDSRHEIGILVERN